MYFNVYYLSFNYSEKLKETAEIYNTRYDTVLRATIIKYYWPPELVQKDKTLSAIERQFNTYVNDIYSIYIQYTEK